MRPGTQPPWTASRALHVALRARLVKTPEAAGSTLSGRRTGWVMLLAFTTLISVQVFFFLRSLASKTSVTSSTRRSAIQVLNDTSEHRSISTTERQDAATQLDRMCAPLVQQACAGNTTSPPKPSSLPETIAEVRQVQHAIRSTRDAVTTSFVALQLPTSVRYLSAAATVAVPAGPRSFSST